MKLQLKRCSNREENSVGDEVFCSLPKVYLYILWLLRWTSVWQVPDQTVSHSGVQLNWPGHLLKGHLMLQDNYRLYTDIESTC